MNPFHAFIAHMWYAMISYQLIKYAMQNVFSSFSIAKRYQFCYTVTPFWTLIVRCDERNLNSLAKICPIRLWYTPFKFIMNERSEISLKRTRKYTKMLCESVRLNKSHFLLSFHFILAYRTAYCPRTYAFALSASLLLIQCTRWMLYRIIYETQTHARTHTQTQWHFVVQII